MPAFKLSRNTWIRLIVYGGLFGSLGGMVLFSTTMPGASAEERGEVKQSGLAAWLETQVRVLSEEYPERNVENHRDLQGAAKYLDAKLRNALLWSSLDPPLNVVWEKVPTPEREAYNLYVEFPGEEPGPLIVVGAHYDTAPGTPGANDNGSGVAVALFLAIRFADSPPPGPVRVVLFTNEEPPHFQTQWMGSVVHAKGCKRRGEKIAAMLSLETMGYFTDEPKSQKYPLALGPLYPSEGNFIAFVGHMGSRELVTRALGAFRDAAHVPSEGGVFPANLPGIGWSDHWSFWKEGYPALMVSDTALFRYPHYHKGTDSADRLDYQALALVAEGLEPTIRELSLAAVAD